MWRVRYKCRIPSLLASVSSFLVSSFRLLDICDTPGDSLVMSRVRVFLGKPVHRCWSSQWLVFHRSSHRYWPPIHLFLNYGISCGHSFAKVPSSGVNFFDFILPKIMIYLEITEIRLPVTNLIWSLICWNTEINAKNETSFSFRGNHVDYAGPKLKCLGSSVLWPQPLEKLDCKCLLLFPDWRVHASSIHRSCRHPKYAC